ncbi:hypothetical protein [Bosea sp. ASV33]|uniref:hypothetical protein n=1 Tax=Bosea sp. ASV33 TaxID=2795106 RepID=UPI0018EBC97C|nr:hypothetical protein [Bosea sp. ASV33]
MRSIAAAALFATGVVATGLAGCQTMEQPRRGADELCSESGLRPGTRSFRTCVSSHYGEERRQSDAAAGAQVVGATAGLGGVATVAEGSARFDRRGYYGGSAYYAARGSPYDTGFYGNPQPYLRGGCDVWGC